MEADKNGAGRLEDLAESFASISELAERLQADYREISQLCDQQCRELEETNRQLAEALSNNSQLSTYLNTLLECLSAGVIAFDTGGMIKLFNLAAERLTGISREQALGQNYRSVFQGEEHLPTYRLLEPGDHRVRGEKWFGEQAVAYASSAMRSDVGTVEGVVEILYDISTEKRLRETIGRVAALQAVGEMAETVTHRIRNPIAGIIGFADLLQRDLPSDHPSFVAAGNIARGAAELNRLLTNLLEFIRDVEPQLRELDLVEFLRYTTRSIVEDEVFGEGMSIEFSSNINKQLVRCDPVLLRQAIVNIACNASQAMEPDGGVLSVDLECDEAKCRIRFTDTGQGFRNEDGGKLFMPFYTTRSNGTGLGLAMVKKVVESHGGSVTARDRAGGGAVVTIELPIQRT